MADKKQNTATVKITEGKSFGNRVNGAANGTVYDLPVGEEIEVTEAVFNSLKDSRVEMTIVSPLAGEDADEGSSASSTVGGTATRLEPASEGVTDDEGKPIEANELQQKTDEDFLAHAQEANIDGADDTAAKKAPAKKKG